MKIKNKLISYLFRNFDYILRFLYCRMPLVNIILPKLFFWKFYKSDFVIVMQCFETMENVLKKADFSFKNKTVLEIGPGNSYLNAYSGLVRGAKKVILIDKFPRYIQTEKQIDYCRSEIAYFKDLYKLRSIDYINENTCDLNDRKIKFISGEFPAITLNEKIDLIYSISVMHLIKNPELYIKKMSEVIKPGGIMYHQIDLKDKFNNTVDSPFLFYKYSDFTWEHLLTKEGSSYANRLRYLDYLALFNKYGFKLIWHQTEKNQIGNIKINKKFAGRDDLDAGLLDVLLRKE